MAHYAYLDQNNTVIEVITGKDETDTLPDEFSSWEEYYLTQRSNASDCKRTSYNTHKNQHLAGGTPFRGNYAGVGMTYDSDNDVFITQKPFSNWTLNETTWSWEAPIAYPDDGEHYIWNESSQSWDLVNL